MSEGFDALETWREMASPLTADEFSLAHGLGDDSPDCVVTSNSLLDPAFPDFLRNVSFIVVDGVGGSWSELDFISDDEIVAWRGAS